MNTFCTLETILKQEDRERHVTVPENEISPSLLAAIAETQRQISGSFHSDRRVMAKLRTAK